VNNIETRSEDRIATHGVDNKQGDKLRSEKSQDEIRRGEEPMAWSLELKYHAVQKKQYSMLATNAAGIDKAIPNSSIEYATWSSAGL
jgi:hypothetical protein